MELIAIAVAFAIVNVVTIWAFRSQLRREQDHHEELVASIKAQRELTTAREDRLLDRIQAPQVAAAQSLATHGHGVDAPPITAGDDDAMAQYEIDREKLQYETAALIAQYENEGALDGS